MTTLNQQIDEIYVYAVVNQDLKLLRKLLVREYGARNYRITSSGIVHIYGQMPNSTVTGWWLKGTLLDVMSDYCIR